MNQIALAWPSVRRRPASFFATFVTVLLGSALVMTFASLLETLLFASVPVDDASEQTLLLIGVVTGGWGLVLVLFAVSSTLTVALRQRDREVSLLKAAGATPAQIRLTVVFEALILTGFAVVVAVPMAWAAGSWFLGQLQANGLVTSAIPHSFGPISIGVATVVAGSGAVGAALVAARRSAKQTTRESIVSASVEAEGMSRFRSLVGRILVASGVVCGILTAVLFRGSGIDAMSTGAQASLLTAIGLALLAPGFVQATARGMSRIGGASGGVAWHLAELSMGQRSQTLSGLMAPVIVLVGVGVGDLTMQIIESNTSLVGTATSAEAQAIENLNYITVIAIVAFAAVMLTNTVVTTTGRRRGEFAGQRLAGASRLQVLRSIAIESTVLALVGVGLGLAAAMTTVVPYGYARIGEWWPGIPGIVFWGLVGTAIGLSVVAALTTARSSMVGPPTRAR